MLGYFLFNIFARALHQSCLLGAGTCDACACELFAGGLRSKCTCGAYACELFTGGLRFECACACACACELFAGGLRFECTCGACACKLFPSLHQWKLDVKIGCENFIMWNVVFEYLSYHNSVFGFCSNFLYECFGKFELAALVKSLNWVFTIS